MWHFAGISLYNAKAKEREINIKKLLFCSLMRALKLTCLSGKKK
jgi:hypothetical protein